MKIFAKYSLLLLSLLTLSAGSITVLALRHHQRALTQQALLRGESIAVNLALVSAEAILTKNVLQLVALSMDATTRHENVVYAAVVDAKGKVLAHPDRAAVDKPFAFEESGRETAYALQAEVRDGRGMGQAIWDLSVPVKAKGSLVELGRVHVGIDKLAVERSVRSSLAQLVLVALASFALAMAVSFYAVRVLVRPLQQLSRASARVGEGDFEVSVPVQSQDEVGELSANFNRMVGNLKLAEARKREASRIETELELAHGIQAGLLPTLAPDLPGIELAFYCEPAKELGGDYYDWYSVQGGRKLGFIVADVSGKGVPAALHMANLRNLFRFISAQTESPREVVRQVNAMAYPDLGGHAFVTLVYGVLDPKSGELAYVNAGHDPAFLVRKSGEMQELEATGFPVGVVDSEEYDAILTEKSLVLGPGDLFFLYTDGVTEAMNHAEQQFGLTAIRARLKDASPAAMIRRLKDDLHAHLEGQAPQDDVTMLALKRTEAA